MYLSVVIGVWFIASKTGSASFRLVSSLLRLLLFRCGANFKFLYDTQMEAYCNFFPFLNHIWGRVTKSRTGSRSLFFTVHHFSNKGRRVLLDDLISHGLILRLENGTPSDFISGRLKWTVFAATVTNRCFSVYQLRLMKLQWLDVIAIRDVIHK